MNHYYPPEDVASDRADPVAEHESTMSSRHRSPVLVILIACLGLLPWTEAAAGLDDCLKAAMNTADPDDVKKAAMFAANHPACLADLVPPHTVPYVAMAGSLDAANQSGALNQVGLGFNGYAQCKANFDPGHATLKQLAPVLKPICSSLNMDCQVFEGSATDQVNAQLVEQVPLLSMLPCACAAATSGLGVEKLAKLTRDAQQCASTVGEIGKALSSVASGGLKLGQGAVDLGEDAAKAAVALGEDIAKSIGSAGCAISKLWGGCEGTPPSYKTAATAICKDHGSTWWAASKTGKPDDVFAQCNDGLYCWAWPGSPLKCEQRRTPSERQQDLVEMKQWCPQRQASLVAGYHAQCHDGLCKVAANHIASQYLDACLETISDEEEQSLPTDRRHAEYQDWMASKDPGFISKFDTLVIESIRRDPDTTPEQLLATYDCRTFLGRKDEYSCKWEGGFQQCRKLVDAGKMKKCWLAGNPMKEYSAPILQGNALRAAGEAIQSAKPPRTRTLPVDTRPVDTAPIRPILPPGCERSPGRANDLTCADDAGFASCLRLFATRQVGVCRNAASGEVRRAVTLDGD